jgi:hypothetical protein
MDSCHGELSGSLIEVPEDKDGRMNLEYARSWTRPKKPDRTSAKARIPMPDAYVYGLTGDDDDERDSEAERVVIMTPVVTRITDMTCVRLYLTNEINIMFNPKISPKTHTFYLTPTIQ